MDFNKSLNKVALEVAKQYPDAYFYEANVELLKSWNGKPYPEISDACLFIFGRDTDHVSTIEATMQGGVVYLNERDAAWSECRPMCHRTMIGLEGALERVKDYTIVSGFVVLKHDINQAAAQPYYTFQTTEGKVQVGANNGEVVVLG